MSEPEATASQGQYPSGPLRLLVSSWPHLVPGNNKMNFLEQGVCRHHFNRRFVHSQFRVSASNCDNRREKERCHVLLDYGEADNDDDVPVVSYEWNGHAFKSAPRIAESREAKYFLKEVFKFTPVPFHVEEKLRPSPTVRSSVLRKLMVMAYEEISKEQIKHLAETPEDLKWVKEHITRHPERYAILLSMVHMRFPRMQKEE
ncbi:hypothetical protein FQN54_004344 [Arachnomyces sp. PD_36]|nr:hypothetical protein FQN54_004344 [Arachnomyces sp. PD_36]